MKKWFKGKFLPFLIGCVPGLLAYYLILYFLVIKYEVNYVFSIMTACAVDYAIRFWIHRNVVYHDTHKKSIPIQLTIYLILGAFATIGPYILVEFFQINLFWSQIWLAPPGTLLSWIVANKVFRHKPVIT